MDIVQETPPSFLTRALRWLAHFERAMDMEPVDRLELRVAELERRLAATEASNMGPSQEISTQAARRV